LNLDLEFWSLALFIRFRILGRYIATPFSLIPFCCRFVVGLVVGAPEIASRRGLADADVRSQVVGTFGFLQVFVWDLRDYVPIIIQKLPRSFGAYSIYTASNRFSNGLNQKRLVGNQNGAQGNSDPSVANRATIEYAQHQTTNYKEIASKISIVHIDSYVFGCEPRKLIEGIPTGRQNRRTMMLLPSITRPCEARVPPHPARGDTEGRACSVARVHGPSSGRGVSYHIRYPNGAIFRWKIHINHLRWERRASGRHPQRKPFRRLRCL
jgi:hypothetical protein